jgi:hypothetical protein
MERPFSLVAVLAGCVVVTTAIRAEDRSSEPRRARAISPRVAEMLTAAAVQVDAAQAAERGAQQTESPEGATPVPERLATDESRSGRSSVRLPDYIVRDRKPQPPLTPEQVMMPRALEQLAMQEFLGDEQGLDRTLNTLTLAHLWKKIPVLGRFPFSFVTNEERAMYLYRADREAKKWAELGSLLAPELRAETKKTPPSTPASPSSVRK